MIWREKHQNTGTDVCQRPVAAPTRSALHLQSDPRNYTIAHITLHCNYIAITTSRP
ncbi:hypothetical protein J6590_056260 [Homalodisca vitripennis]|nr:hypothetical protein J6590_056260 [Homalodisca vitripennis]